LPAWATIPDPVAGANATGQVRYDRRAGPSDAKQPLLVLLGGMTQTISSWAGQIRPLSGSRPVMAYEARGQGQPRLAVDDCGFAQHVADFVALVDALDLPTPLDLCGFSFGARVCLAIAAEHPELVRRLVVSGVGLERGVVGRLIVDGWRATLRTGDLETLARVSLTDILGPAWLEQHARDIDAVIAASVQRNHYDAIEALFEHTTRLPADSPWTIAALAPRIRCPALVMGGAHDRVAPPDDVTALAQQIDAQHRIFPDAGHTIPIEAAADWRAAVVAFLQ
jgi:pimeloyl-ACP methyl ester carboxylesterase